MLATPGGSADTQATAPNEPPLFQRGDEGRKAWAMGVQVTLRAMDEATGGSYAMFEDLVPPGVSNPAHVHTREVETWYVLDGELDWFIGDRGLKARAGDFLRAPSGVPHRSGNSGDRPARMLLTYAPAGFEQRFWRSAPRPDRARLRRSRPTATRSGAPSRPRPATACAS